MRYVGVDLTSALSRHPRPVDIAFLEGDFLRLTQWSWPSYGVGQDFSLELANEFAAAISWDPLTTIVALDGPQGLAKSGKVRRAELELATPGRTPSEMPDRSQPFASYIESSIRLFRALLTADLGFRLAGLNGLEQEGANLFEVFPGAEWRVLLNRRVPRKSSPVGRQLRGQIWTGLGLTGAPSNPSPDQNDAIVAAFLARWASTGEHPTTLVGHAPFGAPPAEGYILHAAAPLQLSRDFDSSSDPSPGEEDWAQDSYILRFTDDALLHGTHADNRWIAPGANYRARVSHLDRLATVTLTASSDFQGRRAWKCDPTPRSLLRDHLGMAIPSRLSNDQSSVVRVETLDQIPLA